MSIITSELLYHAMRLAGITLDPGTIPSPDQFNDALMAFNRMMGGWNTLRDNIFNLSIDEWTLTPNIQVYLLGPGAAATPTTGAFNGPRPRRIERAKLLLQTTPETIYKELNLLSDDEWADKSIHQVTTIPNDLYNDGNSPLCSLYFYPLPDSAYKINLYTWQALAKAALTTTLLDFPDGYEDAIVNNLAVRVAPMFRKQAPPEVRLQAQLSLAAIQSLNTPTPRLKTDPAFGSRGAFYNYRTGTSD